MEKNNSIKKYKDKNILITGGLGFIGSNVAHKLVPLGAQVTVLDNLASLYGGNRFNVEEIKDKIKVFIGDIRDEKLIKEVVADKDIIFDFAAQVSHIDSGSIPFEDLDINCKGRLILLEACRNQNIKPKVLFASSRLALGKILENPVTENHPTNPLNLYGVHKLTAEKYFSLYQKIYGVPTTVLRLTNPYGERQQIKHSKYSIPGWFMRLVMENKPIKIFGDGKQLRDYIHISDVVDAFLFAGTNDKTNGQIYNCGFGESVEFRYMAELVVKTVGSGRIEHIPWPENYEKEETGDFETDISKLKKDTGWSPNISIREGLKKMWSYYKTNKDMYIAEK